MSWKFNPFTQNLDEVGDGGGGGVPTSRTLEIAGTTDQINVSPTGAQDLSANRSWTLSLPQDIATTSTPTFAGGTFEGDVLISESGNLALRAAAASSPGNLEFRESGGQVMAQLGYDSGSDNFIFGGQSGGAGLFVNSTTELAGFRNTNTFTVTFDAESVTADRVFTLQDADGTLAFVTDIITDHGGLTGLSDDDHPQYVLADGTRAMDMLTVNGTTQGIVVEITGFNAVDAGRFIIDSSDSSTVGAIYASNDTNFAHSGYIAKLEAKNATDSGVILSLINAGSGNYITADSVFSVTKAGNVNAVGATLSGLTASQPVVTDGSKNLASISYATFAGNINASLDHGALLGLSDDDHTQYALLAGRSGGQTLIGGTASGNNLTLQSTSNATRGKILFGSGGTTVYDEVNDRFGIRTATPGTPLSIKGKVTFDPTVADSNAAPVVKIDTDNAFTATGFGSTAGATWIQLLSATTLRYRIDWGAGNAIRHYAPGRLDFESAGQVFFTSTGFFFQAHASFNRTGDASSTATQKDSYSINLQNSLWTGAASSQRFVGFRSRASTTDNLDAFLDIYMNVTGGLGTFGTTVMTIQWDDSRTMAVISTTKEVDFGAATSFEVPNGAGGTTVDAAGEMTLDTTSRTLNFHDGTLEAVLNPVREKAVTIYSPTAAEDLTLWYADDAITITKMVFVITGSTSVTVTIRHHTDRSNAGNEVVTGGTTANSTTTGNVVTSFNDATIPADSFVWLETTGLSGTPSSLSVTIYYRQDA